MKNRFKWRHQYDVDRDDEEGAACATVNDQPSLTQQQFTEDADINTIAHRFGLNQIPVAPVDPAAFRDTTGDPDLAQILSAQNEARENFMALPAKLRRRFHDSPRELWDFVMDPENAEEAVRLGILRKPAEPALTGTQSDSAATAPATNATDPTTQGGAPKSPPESARP